MRQPAAGLVVLAFSLGQVLSLPPRHHLHRLARTQWVQRAFTLSWLRLERTYPQEEAANRHQSRTFFNRTID